MNQTAKGIKKNWIDMKGLELIYAVHSFLKKKSWIGDLAEYCEVQLLSEAHIIGHLFNIYSSLAQSIELNRLKLCFAKFAAELIAELFKTREKCVYIGSPTSEFTNQTESILSQRFKRPYRLDIIAAVNEICCLWINNSSAKDRHRKQD